MASSHWPNRRLRAIDRALRGLSSGRSPVEAEVAALDHRLPEAGVCFDIGAAFGLYTLTFAARVGPAGRVFSFEPLPGPRAFLHGAVRGLGVTNVTISDQALGDRRGRGQMSMPKRRGIPVPGRSFLADEADGLGPNAEFPSEQRITVPVSTLDAVVGAAGLDRVDLVKIDVEGYEPTVLNGADETVRRYRPTLLLEIERRHLHKFGADPATIVSSLAGQGYEMTTLWHGRWRRVDTVTEQHRNYLFTPR